MNFAGSTSKWVMVILLYVVVCGTLNAQRCGSDDWPLREHKPTSIVALRSTIIIPLVFHIVASSDEEDISDAQIKSQIEILNQEFGGTVRNNHNIPKEFSDVRGFANIRFCLAAANVEDEIDSGITRTRTSIDFIADALVDGGRKAIFYDEYGGKSGWPADKYINIWVGRAQFFGGKASFPDAAPFPEEEGIILDPRFVGDIGLAQKNQPFHLGKTLIHEMGHYLNLPHIWGPGPGGDCGDDDGIDDTPFQREPYTNCPIGNEVSCDSPDMYMNYMDNADDSCIRMFTKDQVSIMLNTLQQIRPGLINNGKCRWMNSDIKIADATYIPGSNLIQTRFEGTDGESAQILLYDIQGKLIYSDTFSAFDIHYIQTDNLAIGVYAIYVIVNDQVFRKRILVF